MAKPAGGVSAQVERLARPVVEQMGLRLWDVRFEKEGPAWFLRIMVDRDEPPMDTDTCALVSRALDPLLDEADPIPQSYYLEVGSPGLGRRLMRDEHFAAVVGRPVRVSLYQPDSAGRRELVGTLAGCDKSTLTVQPEGEEPVVYKRAEIGGAWLADDLDLF